MTRQIILDTETTGLSARLGDRIIEIGCIEMINRRQSGNNWHTYVNPLRGIEEGAKAVHGITDEFLADKRKFSEIADEFLRYLDSAELIIHNAAFDIEFLDAEFGRLGLPSVSEKGIVVIDTLKLARELHPGKRNSLDALCDRYQIDNAHRTLHGALLDAQLLAEVYLAMTRGQNSLAIEPEVEKAPSNKKVQTRMPKKNSLTKVLVVPAEAHELSEHVRLLEGLRKSSDGNCVWLSFDANVDPGSGSQ